MNFDVLISPSSGANMTFQYDAIVIDKNQANLTNIDIYHTFDAYYYMWSDSDRKSYLATRYVSIN